MKTNLDKVFQRCSIRLLPLAHVQERSPDGEGTIEPALLGAGSRGKDHGKEDGLALAREELSWARYCPAPCACNSAASKLAWGYLATSKKQNLRAAANSNGSLHFKYCSKNSSVWPMV